MALVHEIGAHLGDLQGQVVDLDAHLGDLQRQVVDLDFQVRRVGALQAEVRGNPPPGPGGPRCAKVLFGFLSVGVLVLAGFVFIMFQLNLKANAQDVPTRQDFETLLETVTTLQSQLGEAVKEVTTLQSQLGEAVKELQALKEDLRTKVDYRHLPAALNVRRDTKTASTLGKAGTKLTGAAAILGRGDYVGFEEYVNESTGKYVRPDPGVVADLNRVSKEIVDLCDPAAVQAAGLLDATDPPSFGALEVFLHAAKIYGQEARYYGCEGTAIKTAMAIARAGRVYDFVQAKTPLYTSFGAGVQATQTSVFVKITEFIGAISLHLATNRFPGVVVDCGTPRGRWVHLWKCTGPDEPSFKGDELSYWEGNGSMTVSIAFLYSSVGCHNGVPPWLGSADYASDDGASQSAPTPAHGLRFQHAKLIGKARAG